MTTTFDVEFGDDFTDHVREIAEEAVGNMDMSDAITSALGGWTDPSDHYDMSDYVTHDNLPDLDKLERTVETMRLAMVALVTALGKAGIVAEVTHKEEGN